MPGGVMFIALPGAAAVFGPVEGMTGRAFSELDAAAFAIVGLWPA